MTIQYAVKVIQGKTDGAPIGPGIFYTSVNVHNPWGTKVHYSYKLAVSGSNGKPGPISGFVQVDLGSDAVLEYDVLTFNSLYTPSGLLEGYFVITSEQELDVVGVYTGSALQDGHLGAIHMERVPARVIK